MRRSCLLVTLLVLMSGAVSADKATIKVVGPTGKPIPGAHVLVSTADVCPMPGQAAPKTDKNGIHKTDFTGRAAVYVWLPGYVQAAAVLKKGENIIKLEKAGKVSGTVVDKQGKPVLGATLSVWYVERPDGSHSSFS